MNKSVKQRAIKKNSVSIKAVMFSEFVDTSGRTCPASFGSRNEVISFSLHKSLGLEKEI